MSEMEKIKPCPFCNSSTAPKLFTLAEVEGREPDPTPQWVVVCDGYKGGCGASSGYDLIKWRAVERWNRRWNDD